VKWNWIVWTVAGVLVLAIVGGSMFALGRMSGSDGGEQKRPAVQTPRPSEEERELQKIKIAASETTLEEARRTPDGWVVHVASESKELDLKKLSEGAAKFFKELARSGVEIAATSYVVRTNDLKDVWGNRLRDVPLLRVELDKQTFARVNWDGFDPQNFPRITGDFWIHDLVAQKAREQEQQGGGQQGQGGQGGGQAGGGGGENQADAGV